MDEKQILFFINDALANGASSADIDTYISTLPPETQQSVRLLQQGQSKGGAVGDFARMAAQGLSFGFADELVGMMAGPEARERSRQRVSTLRSNNPGASLMSEMAGGMLLPGMGGAGGSLAKGGVRAAAGRGAALGAAEGALYGAGNAVEGERGMGALVGGGVGAVTGGVAGPVVNRGAQVASRGGSRARSLLNRIRGIDPDGPGPGPRIAESLMERSGIEAGINDALGVADKSLDEISATVFSKLDEEFPTVDNAAVTTFVRGLTDNRDTRSIVGAVSRELREGNRLPSFSEVQAIRRRLINKGLRDEADELTDIMEEVFGERFIEANAEWRRLSRIKDALLEGEKSWNMGANQLERKLGGMGEAERTAFQQGRMSELVQRLQRRDQSAVSPLTSLLDAGPSTRRQLRTFFDTDAAFNGFMEELQQVGQEIAASSVKPDHVRRLTRWLIPAAIGGGGAAGGASLYNFLRGN